MKGIVIGIGALALLAACGAGGSNKADEANAAAPVDDYGRNLYAHFRDCPPGDYLCDRQNPVIADGVRPFVRDEINLSVIFPAGAPVCILLTGRATGVQQPFGFNVSYDPPGSCQVGSSRFITLTAQRSDGRETLDPASHPIPFRQCPPFSADTRRRLAAAPLAVPGFTGLTCVEHDPGQGTLFAVTFLGGPWLDPNVRRGRKFIYDFMMGTDDAHLDEDLARFRQVLASVRISERD